MKYVLDNSNLSESYSGVTTPLTYSFASHAYREVYKHYCRGMGVSNSTINRHSDVFSDLLCFVGYRMYYNLRSWHSVVSFLPAYQFNRRFFDRMLGVETDNPYYEIPESSVLRKYLIDLPRIGVQIVRIGFNLVFMGALVRRFNRQFDEAFAGLQAIKLDCQTSTELVSLFQNSSRDLLARWWVPIANDFAVMISTGIASKALANWSGQTDISSHLYLEARGSLISLDPGKFLLQLVQSIKKEGTLHKLFLQERTPAEILELLSMDFPDSDAFRLIKQYLASYGSRVPNELKLESETLTERPELLISLLQSLIRGNSAEIQKSTCQHDLLQNERLHLNTGKRRLLKWLMSWVGNSIRRREETRLRRALIFGYVRRIFLAIGNNLYNEGIIADSRDIFYLTMEEVFNLENEFFDSKTAKGLIARRKAERQEWQESELPRRIESDDELEELIESLRNRPAINKRLDTVNMLKGTVASRGSVNILRGEALVLPEFSPSADFHGKVLVTSHTDPGWTIIFPFLKGLIVERGGSLSHAAIVARELGIPCVMGVENAVNLIPDKTNVEMNLTTGEIHVSNLREPAPATSKEEICV